MQTYSMHALKFSCDVEIVGPLDTHHVPLTALQGQTCRRCQKLNHFAKWCRSAPVQAHAQRNPRSNTTTPAIIHSINTNSAGFSTCAVNIAESCIPLILDTGAKVSLLNMSTYDRFLPHLPLQPPSLNLFGYGSSAIDVIGLIHAPVQYDNKALPNFPFHITRHGSNILGLDLFMSLDFLCWTIRGLKF